MSPSEFRTDEVAVGKGITTIDAPPNAVFRLYTADRPPMGRLQATETVLDVDITMKHPIKMVWPIFKDFNLWMNRFGYFWNCVPADNENHVVSLVNRGANEVKVAREGAPPSRYIVRKVIPEHLIYLDQLPLRGIGIDAVGNGHTVANLSEERGQTKIVFFMEHTAYSEAANIEELRAELKKGLDVAAAFWRDYFIPDLISAVESRSSGSSKERK